MRALHHSVFLKREQWKKAKLSVFKLMFAPIFTYVHDGQKSTARNACVRNKIFAKYQRCYKVEQKFVTLRF